MVKLVVYFTVPESRKGVKTEDRLAVSIFYQCAIVPMIWEMRSIIPKCNLFYFYLSVAGGEKRERGI